jgi:ferric-dicitrate binding protein FerR (iron transport regulator)
MLGAAEAAGDSTRRMNRRGSGSGAALALLALAAFLLLVLVLGWDGFLALLSHL